MLLRRKVLGPLQKVLFKLLKLKKDLLTLQFYSIPEPTAHSGGLAAVRAHRVLCRGEEV